MQSKYPIGILGATGMVGQRFIQLLENHPWFEVAWLAASDRSSGRKYGDAAKWRLDSPLPDRIARMTISTAEPAGAPRIIFAALDADIAREMEPKFAAAGCAVVSNSSAFRMHANVPLVIPEVNPEHLHLIEEQPWRKESGGYMVTNPNCSAIGLVMALKPLEERFGLEQIFVATMQAVSGAGYPGVPSMDILGNVVPYIKSEEEKMEAETLKLLGRLAEHVCGAAGGKDDRPLQPRGGGGWAHRERLDQAGQQVGPAGDARRHAGRVGGVSAAGRAEPAHGAGAAGGVGAPGRSSPAAAGSQSRTRHGRDGRPPAALRPAGLEVYSAVAQHHSRRRGCCDSECGVTGEPGQAGACSGGRGSGMRVRGW